MRYWILPAILLILAGAVFLLKDRIFPRTGAGPRNAVLVVLDTMRADRLSCYGYARETSPNLSRLADRGVLFEETVVYSPWTLPSMVNLFSGRFLTRQVFQDRLRRSLVEAVRDAGFETAAFTEGGYVSSFFGLDRGFDLFVEEEGAVQRAIPGKPEDLDPQGGIENTFRLAGEWLEANRDESFFLFIHTYEPHAPYRRRTFTKGLEPGRVGETFELDLLEKLQAGEVIFDENDLEYLNALYDGGIFESDRHVGALLRLLDRLGLRDETLVVVTSDHGEELGEHYPAFSGDHGHSVFDELVLVPLIIHDPMETYPKRRVRHQVRLMDVMPTILAILGIDGGGSVQGTSLLPLMRGEEVKGRMAFGGMTKAGPERVFLRWLDYKYIKVVNPGKDGPPLKPRPAPVALFDLQEDPEELSDLSATETQVMVRMKEVLSRIMRSGMSAEQIALPEDLDDKLRERLESLGYIR
jgi:arylsulfatase A-like enzyme